MNNIIGAIVCFSAGVVVALVNYAVSKKILSEHPEKLAMSTLLRQVLQVGFLAAVYFIGSQTECSIIYLLMGAAVGITLPMLFLTKKLIAFNEEIHRSSDGEEEKKNG